VEADAQIYFSKDRIADSVLLGVTFIVFTLLFLTPEIRRGWRSENRHRGAVQEFREKEG
jgi:hypothetical protein